MKIDKDRLDNYLKKVYGSPCPLCRTNSWHIMDEVFQAIEFDYRGLIVGGSALPIVPLTCRNCGNTYFINALVANLIDPLSKKEEGISDTEKESSRG